MTKISKEIEKAISKLKENKVIILQTSSGFQLVSSADHKPNINTMQNIKQPPDPINPVYFFSNISQIKMYSKEIPKYLALLIEAFTPGPVAFILPSNQTLGDAQTITCTIPENPEILKIISEVNQPLATTSANPAEIPAFANLSMVKNYFAGKVDMILTLEPAQITFPDLSVLDCTEDGVIKIIRPGAIKTNEIQSILPKHIRLEKAYKTETAHRLKLSFPIFKKDYINNDDKHLSVIIGTKEKLNQTFNLEKSEYFTLKKHGNFLLLNLGSQTSPETIAKNIYKNLFSIEHLAVSKGLLLWQDWGSGHWGEIIEYTLSRFVVDSLQTEVQG
jgi:L-threonylcarbamoyladenylate synthase